MFTATQDTDDSTEEELEFIRSEFKSVEQISDELITLSLLASSRWQNLLNLDVIKVCILYIFLDKKYTSFLFELIV